MMERGFAATVRRNSFSNKEKQIWVIRGKKTKAQLNPKEKRKTKKEKKK
jgi:hypothetical protein